MRPAHVAIYVAVACAGLGCGSSSRESGHDGGTADAGGTFDASVPVDAEVGMDAGGSDASVPACAVTGPCDPVQLTGCQGSDVCELTGAVPVCVPPGDAGVLGEGAPCASTTDPCGPGLACFSTAGGGGECDRVCCGSAASCGSGERCGGGRLVDGADIVWGRCLSETYDCNLLDPTGGCEPAEACYVVDAAGTTACRAAGTGTSGVPCTEPSDCAPGYECWGLVGSTCRRICDTTAALSPCPAGEGLCTPEPSWPADTGLCTN